MIDRKKTQYVILYVNHNISSIVTYLSASVALSMALTNMFMIMIMIVQWDPKVSVLLWLERRRTAQSEDTPKAIHQWCFRGIFSGCRSGSKTKIF